MEVCEMAATPAVVLLNAKVAQSVASVSHIPKASCVAFSGAPAG